MLNILILLNKEAQMENNSEIEANLIIRNTLILLCKNRIKKIEAK